MLKKSFDKFERQNNNLVGCNSEKTNSENKKSRENLYLSCIIGTLNVERWNELKIVFSCETNEHFATKLLDIAQEYVSADGFPSTNKIDGEHCESNYEGSFAEGIFIGENFKQNKSKPESNKKHFGATNNHTLLQEPTEIEKEIKKLSECTNKINSVLERSFDNAQDDKPENGSTATTEVAIKKMCIKPKKKNPVVNKSKEKPSKDFDTRRAPELQVQKIPPKDNSNGDIDTAEIKIKTCQLCNTNHINNLCPITDPHFIIADALSFQSWESEYKNIHTFNNSDTLIIKNEKGEDEDSSKYSFARLSLPDILYFCHVSNSHGLGVFAKSKIQPFTQFGPLIGTTTKEVDISEESNMRDIWEMVLEGANIYLNTESLEAANWLRYIRPAPTRDKHNITVTCQENKLHFVTTCLVDVGEELLYWQDNCLAGNKKKMEKTTCGGCNMTFAHPLYYRTHCSVFHDVRFSLTIRKYHCKVCGAAVLGKENIMKHAAELHNGQGAYQCQFCKKFFLRLNYLEMHRTYGCSANPHRSRPLCDFCGRKFCQPQKLKVHIKRMHSDMSEVLKEFQCKNCSKILGSRAALQRHMKEVHQKQMDGACSCTRCGKHFQNKSNLKIHMLTHSGIKPFKCGNGECNAAFTTKQCLQFHYKKVHNYTEDNMPKIERSVDYTFQAYSGLEGKLNRKGNFKNEHSNTEANRDSDEEDNEEDEGEEEEDEDEESDIDDASLDSKSMDDPPALQSPLDLPDEESLPPPPQTKAPSPPDTYVINQLNTHMKVVSKGSKKWIADEPLQPLKQSDLYSIERLSKDDLPSEPLHESELYDRGKLPNVSEFNRVEPSNASLLVEAALDSVCSEPNIDIDVSTTPNCSDSIVTNLYTLTQSSNLEVSYSDTVCMTDGNLISPSVNDQISVTDEINDELRHSQNISIDYPSFHQENFISVSSTNVQRLNFVKNYINSLSPHNMYDVKNMSPVPSPPRYDFGHATANEQISSDDSNGMAAQNLSLNNAKNDIQLDLSMYKSYQRTDSQIYIKRLKFETENALESDIDIVSSHDLSGQIPESDENHVRNKYSDDLSTEVRNKFELDLDLRLKNYESIDSEVLRQRSATYENDLGFRNKNYDFMDSIENRALETEFRPDRNFEPLVLNSSSDLQLQGLDMSARSLHSYPTINRYHHLYPDVDRVDLRLNYSPPPPPYSHDLLRVMSLDLTPPGRHSVDLSLRSHPLHQIANTRLLAEHTLQSNHRLLDQSRLLSSDLTSTRLGESRLMTEPGARILSDHTTNRILGNTDHLLNSEQNRLIADDSRVLGDTARLLEQRGLIGDGRILPPTAPSDAVSPVPFSVYPVPQSSYHPTPIAPRPHVTSPTPTPYHHYTTYY